MTARTLPEPGRGRWQPLRTGLIDLFYYDVEEFWFRDGRLLLRGNNGTGKSKVLALTLPFLLDGELSPHRVEPDGDPKKRMDWNLLLGGAHPHPERLGYAWIEFGRRDEQGRDHYRTLGCGLKAVTGRGIARHWFFVTTQRIGAELSLVDATRTALTRDRLIDALGEQGTVYDRVRDYRRAVDETFFDLGEQRYAALVDLLVQLRQPQLSKRPSESALSAALTEALPPIDQAVIADVAESFRSLEEDRYALTALDEAQRAAASFLEHYRRYAEVTSRRRAAGPREAQSAYERVNRDLAEAERDLTSAQAELDAAEQQLAELITADATLQARREALRDSPEMRSAEDLRRAADDAHRLSQDATGRAEDRDNAHTTAARRREQALAAEAEHRVAADVLTAARAAAAAAGVAALVETAHTDRIDSALTAPATVDQALLARVGTELVERQLRGIRHLRELARAADAASRHELHARQQVDELDGALTDLAERQQESAETAAHIGGELVEAIRRHLDSCTELVLADRAAPHAALELWVETLDGVNPARVAAESAHRAAAERLARRAADLAAAQDAASRSRAELQGIIARLEAGEDAAPPVPHTRDESARQTRKGAPLWRLVDFADAVPDSQRAGLEAALEAAGILDAWLSPDGQLLDADDVLLDAAHAPAAANSLLGTLLPAVDRADKRAASISDETVATVLAAIGLGAATGPTWVAPDGGFRLGVLEGRWRKPTATLIGRGARDAHRRATISARRGELAAFEAELAALEAEQHSLAAQRATLAGELATFPPDDALRGAHAEVGALLIEHNRLSTRRDSAIAALAQATQRSAEAADELHAAAAELGLPASSDRLDEIAEAVAEYRGTLAELWPAVHRQRESSARQHAAIGEVADADAELARRAELAEAADILAAAATERHTTLQQTVGAAVADLERRLAAVSDGLRANERNRKAADNRKSAALEARGRAEGRRETLTGELAEATERRARATESLRRFAGTGLLAVALPTLAIPDPQQQWAPTPTVLLARDIDRDLADTPDGDEAAQRVMRRVNEEFKALADTLARHGNSASAAMHEDGIVVEVVFAGRPSTVPAVVDALGDEVAERQRLLDEREREILENHLVSEVASTLQELVTEANHSVAEMNDELEQRPTSTGMRLKLVWQPREDGPAGLAEARSRLLRQVSDAWSSDDRQAIGAFLQARIAEVRAADPTGTWLDHLSAALDYRTWHRFAILRHQNGAWRSATGPASGGERVLAASVPLFAAASSHYRSAGNPHAPRLVMLDEAFAGVDDDSRSKCMGLLTSFDLDVVMTSEREWGCYPDVPGLAIAQLSRTDDLAAVLVTSWEWDGRTRVRVPRPVATVAADPDGGADSLWS